MAKFKLDRSHKLILGVCSGLSRSLKVNIYYVRFIFIFSTFFGGGAGILIYLLMWISFFPTESEHPKLMGVCSRLAEKYGFDISIVRLITTCVILFSGIVFGLTLYFISGLFLKYTKKEEVIEPKIDSTTTDF